MSLLIICCPLLFPYLPTNAAQAAGAPSVVRMLDLDGDGHLDKLFLGTDGSLRVALHTGGRSYLAVPQELPRVSVVGVLVDDLDEDGSLDLLLVASGNNVVLSGDGTGHFRETTLELGLGDAGEGLSAERVDLDEDGRPDLILHNRAHDVLFWARAQGGYERDAEALEGESLPRAPLSTSKAMPARPQEAHDLAARATTRGRDGSEVLRAEGSPDARRSIENGGQLGQGSEHEALSSFSGIVQGSGTAGRLPKWIGPRKLGNSELSESAGNVGIGTLSPAGRLDVAGTIAVNGSPVIDGAGQWIGDPTGLIGPTGPTGPPGVVSFAPGNTRGGTDALLNNTTGGSNSAFGVDALRSNTTGSHNTATGRYALNSNTTGVKNTANGTFALNSNTTGKYNTASGVSALLANTIGSRNTASGFAALYSNTTGGSNTASGCYALVSNTTGFKNTACGIFALYQNTSGSENVALGLTTLSLNTTGIKNTASGTYALSQNRAGSRNTASGGYALYRNTSGDRNIGVGYGGGRALTTGDDNIAIGNSGVPAESSTTRIGSVQTRAFIAGIRGVTTGMANGITVLIDGSGQLGTVSSSRRFKEDITDMGDASDRLLDLRAVLFRYKERNTTGDGPIEFGLIAEEVAEIFPELVVYDEEGQPFTVKYHLLGTLLLNELQKIDERFETRERTTASELEQLRAEVQALRAIVH